MWKEVLKSKYGGWRKLKENMFIYNASLWWKDLQKIWKLKNWGNNFDDCFKWEVDNGKIIKFWEDQRVGNDILKNKFPRLFFSLC